MKIFSWEQGDDDGLIELGDDGQLKWIEPRTNTASRLRDLEAVILWLADEELKRQSREEQQDWDRMGDDL